VIQSARILALETRLAIGPGGVPGAAIAVDAVNLAWDHADPSDRIIVATARRLGAPLVTADPAILEFAASSRAVRVVEI